MSKKSKSNKKGRTSSSTTSKKVVKPTVSRTTRSKSYSYANASNYELLFDKQNYILMAGSLLLILIGFLLMSGGSMPSPDVWDENIIYSFRRITLAPFIVLCGLVLFVFAIFKK